ncbi:MAG: exodeoxyribonuclease VII small subunit [Candidatus Eremiobacterales bacterium]|jgi:exodeoxyribonuclease VII small subunit
MSKTKGKPQSEKGPSFEQALARLEKIVEKLDDGNLPLDESIALFKEGTSLAKVCRDKLAEAEVQVEEALKSAGAAAGDDVDADEADAEDELGDEDDADEEG